MFLTSALKGGEWSASCPNHFTPRKRAISTHSTGVWVGLRTSLGVVAKRKYLCPCNEPNPGHPAHSLVTILAELSRLL